MAGSSMKDIKLRIKSVESTMQITKAMQLVATSKLRRAKERMEASKPYAAISEAAIRAAVRSCAGEEVPFADHREVRNTCVVVVAGERGLAGGYNNNVFKRVAQETEGKPWCVLPIGRKAIEKYQRLGIPMLNADHGHVEGISVSECYRLAKMLTDGYLAGQFDEVLLIYTNFQNMLSQEVRADRLLPIEPEQEEKPRLVSTVYEPEASETLAAVIPDFLTGRLYSAICDSYASEVSARRTAMDSATKNAGEMIDSLSLKYNRARQGAITQEITEIVAGAEH